MSEEASPAKRSSPVHLHHIDRPPPQGAQPGNHPANTVCPLPSPQTSGIGKLTEREAGAVVDVRSPPLQPLGKEAPSRQHSTATAAGPAQLHSPSAGCHPQMSPPGAQPSSCSAQQGASAPLPHGEAPKGSLEQSAGRACASTLGKRARLAGEADVGDDSDSSDGGEASRGDMNAWLYDVLQRVQPGASITVNSLHLLESLFDTLVGRVLSEAQACAEEPAAESQRAGRKRKPDMLTSLQIQKAMRRVLPGEPGDPLRPYLPTETKLARQLDKQSLRGIRSKRSPSHAS